MKRLFDIFFSLIALLLFSLPMLVITLLLAFKEQHNIFFKQERIGLFKKSFQILKFQTLVNDIPTPTGKVLRRTGLDEIPQFINVLKGDMSIVGPRALTDSDIKRLGWDDVYHTRRWIIKPGISGFAQLYGGRHKKTSWFWDMYYIDHRNLLIDFAVIVMSFLINLFGKARIRKLLFKR